MRKRILSPGQEGAKRGRLHEMDSIVQAGARSSDEETWQGELGSWSPPETSAAYWPAPAPPQQQQYIKRHRKRTTNRQDNVWDHEAGGDYQSSENSKAKKAAAIPSAVGDKLPGPWNGTAMKDLLRRLDVAKKIEMIRDENVAWNNEHANQPRLLSLRGSYLKEVF
jgi:hypothetical protein